MLHHQHGAVNRHLLDQLADAVHVFQAHALGGLVEQHQLGVHGQGGGNLQRALAAVAQLHRDGVRITLQIHRRKELQRPVVQAVQGALGAPKIIRGAHLALQGHAHVFQHREVRKNGRDLKRADDAAPRNLRRRVLRDVLPIEQNHARAGLDELGQQVKASGLAGTVGAYQRVDAATANRQVHPVHGHKAFELFAKLLRLENAVSLHTGHVAGDLTSAC